MAMQQLAETLASEETLGRVDGVVESRGNDRFRFTSAMGMVEWRRIPSGSQWQVEIEQSTGVNLLDLHHTDRFLSLEDEQLAFAAGPIAQLDHGRPYAYESLGQLFDDPKVPNQFLVPAASFPLHGNIGNHGSLGSVQSRGLFIGAGPGIACKGWIAEHARMIDVAPTLLAALGVPLTRGRASNRRFRPSRLLAQDGDDIEQVLDPSSGPAEHVVSVVFDGCNTNLVADALAAGELPALASLLARGTGLRQGIVSSFPTVTLPNHLTAFTGVHPGRHGIVNNEFRDFDASHVNLLDFKTMVRTREWMSGDVETIHEAVHRWLPIAFTSASYEYADRGANWSTFGEFREGRRPPHASVDAAKQHATDWAYEQSERYRFITRIDESSLISAIGQWAGEAVTGHPLPKLQLVNFSATDDAGHEVGPHGALARAALIDCDRKLGRLLEAIDAAGALARTAVVVISDHGMEQCDRSLLESHPMPDLTPLCDELRLHEVGDVFLHPYPRSMR
jgi:phosphonoacetate hydrolase